MSEEEVYLGNGFSVVRNRENWTLYRLVGDANETREKITLDTEDMDELSQYFANYYAHDRKV